MCTRIQHGNSTHKAFTIYSQPGLMSTLAPQTVGSSQDSKTQVHLFTLWYIHKIPCTHNTLVTSWTSVCNTLIHSHTYTYTNIHTGIHTCIMVSYHFTEPFLPLSQSLHPQPMRSLHPIRSLHIVYYLNCHPLSSHKPTDRTVAQPLISQDLLPFATHPIRSLHIV